MNIADLLNKNGFVVWWVIWTFNVWRGLKWCIVGGFSVWLFVNLVAQLLNGIGRTFFVQFPALGRRWCAVPGLHLGKQPAKFAAFAFENASHCLACLSIAMLIPRNARNHEFHLFFAAAGVLVNVVLLVVGMQIVRRQDSSSSQNGKGKEATSGCTFSRFRDRVWRLSLPSTTTPIVLLMATEDVLSVERLILVTAMSASRACGILVSDYFRDWFPTSQTDPGWCWFVFCGIGAYVEMDIVFSLLTMRENR